MPRRDVAIYSPYASQLYEPNAATRGGAELQTYMLAAGLAERGLKVGHIVLPLKGAGDSSPAGVDVVERPPFAGQRPKVGKAQEIAAVWRALSCADARVYVFRSGWAAMGIAGLFCVLRRRRLVWASASDLDFSLFFFRGKRADRELFKFGVRRSAAAVVQTGHQARLAEQTFGRLNRVVEIPSFAREAELSAHTPEAFLWTGQLEEFKNPLAYVELARNVPEAKFWMIPRFVEKEASLGEQVKRAADELPNLELLEARPYPEAMELVARSVAVVNTSPSEGMPNTFLEAWARGIPALTLQFDPDGRIQADGLGAAAQGSPEQFAQGARELWNGRADRAELSTRVRDHVRATHGVGPVADRWLELIRELLA